MLELKPARFAWDEFRSQTIPVCGQPFEADMTGALFWPAERALIAADLPLFAPASAVPALERLASTANHFSAETVVALGCRRPPESSSILAVDSAFFCALWRGRDWIWLDPAPATEISRVLGGTILAEMCINEITLRYAPLLGRRTGEIAGRLRPAARVVKDGFALRRPCFVSNGWRLILPAFGTFESGENVLGPAFQELFFDDGLFVWVLGHEGLYPVAPRLLAPD